MRWYLIRDFFRLLPLTIFVCCLVLTIKLKDVAGDLHIFGINTAHAEETKKEETPAAKDEKSPEGKETPKEGSPQEAAPPKDDQKKEDKSAKEKELAFDALLNFSPEEASVISELAKRRHKLDEKEHDLETRTQVLQTIEERVQKQLATAKGQEAVAQKGETAKEEKTAKKLQEIIKIYQSMEAADAARILEALDVSIALAVFSNMSPIKSAPILAAMSKEKAKDITERLYKES
jgi:flagellar motility protein MotE (MotC chaperone)